MGIYNKTGNNTSPQTPKMQAAGINWLQPQSQLACYQCLNCRQQRDPECGFWETESRSAHSSLPEVSGQSENSSCSWAAGRVLLISVANHKRLTVNPKHEQPGPCEISTRSLRSSFWRKGLTVKSKLSMGSTTERKKEASDKVSEP